MGMPEGEERERIQENIFRENAENFPNMGKEIGSQCQDRQSPRQDKSREECTKTHTNENYEN